METIKIRKNKKKGTAKLIRKNSLMKEKRKEMWRNVNKEVNNTRQRKNE